MKYSDFAPGLPEDCLIRDDLRLLTWNTARRSNRETGSYHHYSTNSLTCAWSGARTCTWGGGELDQLQSGDPRRIGPYWLEGRLGSGGMGRVYLGRSPGGRQVAIKVIRPELAEDPDFRPIRPGSIRRQEGERHIHGLGRRS